MSYRIGTYNIENMRRLFKKGKIDPAMQDRAKAIARVIEDNSPHILGVVEASDITGHHERFLNEFGLATAGYRLAKSTYKRKHQDLVFYYREPFEIVGIDRKVEFYKEWIEDIDDDGIEEVCKFERKPLEVLFRHGKTGAELLVILISIKSKGVFTVADLMGHQHLGLANRKRQYAQSKKLRQRVDMLLDEQPGRSVVIMGDFNDDPGLDSLEKILGASALETIMGTVFEPSKILHNALWHMSKDNELKRDLWTTEYPDLIVQNLKKHKGWLDHILVSPGMLERNSPIKIEKNSGRVAQKTQDAKLASDHFLVYCDISIETV